MTEPMGGNEHLTVREFERGLNRIEARFDRLDTKVDGHTERIAALETLTKSRTRKTVTWTGTAAAAIVAILEGVRTYLR